MNTSLTASIEPQFRSIDGLKIRYADTGDSHGTTLLLTSPWPESLYAFAPMWATLADSARLFAVDLPGFGASERRDDHPGRFASVTVGTGGAAVPLQLGEPLRSWVLDPDLDRYRRIDPHVIVQTAMDTIAGGVADDIRADYLACYEGDRFVESMRYARRYPEELPALAELLPEITTPVTIINGRHDRVVPVANAEFLDERLPNSRLVILESLAAADDSAHRHLGSRRSE